MDKLTKKRMSVTYIEQEREAREFRTMIKKLALL
jgi:hypothetical protein